MRPRIVPATMREPFLSGFVTKSLGVEADRRGLGLGEGGVARAGPRRPRPARWGARAGRTGAAWRGRRRAGRPRPGLAPRAAWCGGCGASRAGSAECCGAAGGGRGRGGRLGVGIRQLELAGDLGLRRLARLGGGIGLGDAAEAAVGVGVAVGVLELDELAEALGLTRAHDAAVVDGDHGRAAAGEDLDPTAVLVALDDERGVVADLRLAPRVALLDLAGVGGPWRRPGSGPGSAR